MTAESNWVVLSDFDGTLTTKDIGNELCEHFIPELAERVFEQYRLENMNLRAEQNILWQGFPASEEELRSKAVELAELRPGVEETLLRCREKGIPFYIASCGMDAYINAVLDEKISSDARKAIVEIRCNHIGFADGKISVFETPDSDPRSPVSFDKGRWAAQIRKRHSGSKILGVGDGSSDYSMVSHVDQIYATRKLARKCDELKVPYKSFESFLDILRDPIFST